MREAAGKLICIWSPVLHGEGCSTITDAIGFTLYHRTGKRILIVNKSNSLCNTEEFMAREIEIKYNFDNLKIFNNSIKSDHINTYATRISDNLYMVAGSRISRDITKEDKCFEELFARLCLENFDMVVTDLGISIREDSSPYLDRADVIVAVTSPNCIILDKILEHPEMEKVVRYLRDERTINVFNKLYDGWDTVKVAAGLKKKYNFRNAYGLEYDGDVLTACCTDMNFYSFMIRELNRDNSAFAGQISDVCSFMLDKLYPEENRKTMIKEPRLFSRLLKSSVF